MAAITKAEIISIAFTRNIATTHITDSDIKVAVDQYVDSYIEGVTDASTIYDAYVKPVISYGVAVNVFNRIATEVTDRGVVSMITEGAATLDSEAKQQLHIELAYTLTRLIKLMCKAAEDAGMTLVNQELTSYEVVGFTGNQKIGKL